MRDVTEHDAADAVFFKIERDADRSPGELNHLVIHHVGETVDACNAVRDRANRAGVFLNRFVLKLSDLLFDLFENGAHGGRRVGWV